MSSVRHKANACLIVTPIRRPVCTVFVGACKLCNVALSTPNLFLCNYHPSNSEFRVFYFCKGNVKTSQKEYAKIVVLNRHTTMSGKNLGTNKDWGLRCFPFENVFYFDGWFLDLEIVPFFVNSKLLNVGIQELLGFSI